MRDTTALHRSAPRVDPRDTVETTTGGQGQRVVAVSLTVATETGIGDASLLLTLCCCCSGTYLQKSWVLQSPFHSTKVLTAHCW